MHDQLWQHACQEVTQQAPGEPETGPIMSILQSVQGITFKIHFSREVLLIKGLHRYLCFSTIPILISLGMKVQIMLYWKTWIFDLLGLSRSHTGSNDPEDHEDRNAGEGGKEDPCEETSTDLPSEIQWDQSQKGVE